MMLLKGGGIIISHNLEMDSYIQIKSFYSSCNLLHKTNTLKALTDSGNVAEYSKICLSLGK